MCQFTLQRNVLLLVKQLNIDEQVTLIPVSWGEGGILYFGIS